MGKLTELLNNARARARELGLPYAGALTPKEAHEVWNLAPGAKLVDVRTRAEWDWVGRVPHAVEIDWVEYPDMTRNANFITELRRQVDAEATILILCRSGVRSRSAASAALEVGFTAAYNILEGFEGDKDAYNHRGKLGGWRFHGLPWYQG